MLSRILDYMPLDTPRVVSWKGAIEAIGLPAVKCQEKPGEK